MIAAWLVQCYGPAHLRLLSRTGRVADASAVATLAATAACITTAMADAGSPADAAAALSATVARGPALQAVLHAAGVLADSVLDKQSAGSFRRVFAPKLGGLAAMAAALQRQPVASMALFSSVASLLGAAGQVSSRTLEAWPSIGVWLGGDSLQSGREGHCS